MKHLIVVDESTFHTLNNEIREQFYKNNPSWRGKHLTIKQLTTACFNFYLESMCHGSNCTKLF